MAQEMYKHEALMHLVYAVAKADAPISDEWINEVSKTEKEYFDKIMSAEGITLDFSAFIDKRTNIRRAKGKDAIIQEALKATNRCAREWRVKVYGYMWRMALKSWEGQYYSDGEKDKVTDNEKAIIYRARDYFEITEEENDRCMGLTKV
jgi:hypothetical protein